MRLAELLEGQSFRRLSGRADVQVSGLAHDSRRVVPGDAFFCLTGHCHDGHKFAGEAVARGAVALVVEKPDREPPAGVTVVQVPDSRRALALAAASFWGHPSSELRVLAVTGTNGKTTVNHLNEAVLRAAGHRTGLLGTVENHLGLTKVAASLTTPDALDVQSSLAAMRAARITHACVEVSSHGLAGHRLAACQVDVAVLTNVARDHLDFHEDVRTYAETKLTLFRNLGERPASLRSRPPKSGPVYAVLNADDSFFGAFRPRVAAPTLAYGAVRPAHVKLLGAALEGTGSVVTVRFTRHPRGLAPADWLTAAPGWPTEATVRFPHPGRHNISNLLASLTVAWAEGCSWEAVRAAVEGFPGVKGRWDIVASPDGVAGVVDFAHNPDGLVQALETARLTARGRVILVFGCEGQKDRGKRPVMGAIAALLADHVILTSDNTFQERGQQILDDIEAGLANPAVALPCLGSGLLRRMEMGLSNHRATYEIVTDRREAIFRATALARSGDLVVVAGRGHDVKLVFGETVEILDDRDVLEQALLEACLGRAGSGPGPHSHSIVEGGLEVTS